MKKRIQRWICAGMMLLTAGSSSFCVAAAEETGQNGVILSQEDGGSVESQDTLIAAPSGILMEASTGQVVYEKDADTRRSPASITKIMTLLLIFDNLEKGNLQMDELVTTSAYAKSMGGSQVFLEEGEQQTVETLIKCIVIASGNDASVAMAEHLAGSEQEFVKGMNARAKELGMENTNFEDCCGLTDSQNHYTTARDIAIMSRELIEKYPKILEYSSIWMDTMIHETRQGTSEFGLTNTNKLLRSYEGCVGLKTGSTSLAKYCLSAVAQRKGMTLISVIMAAPDYKVRFTDAASLLNYGFSKCSLYEDENQDVPDPIPVIRGKEEQVPCVYEGAFRYLSTEGASLEGVEKSIQAAEQVEAPVKQGDCVGKAVYTLDGKVLGETAILAAQDVERADFLDYLRDAAGRIF